MIDSNPYDDFGGNYDKFVNWKARLSVEIDFLTNQLSEANKGDDAKISVLDAACGTGQHAIALSKQGFVTTGADNSEKMIEIARKNSRAAKTAIKFEKSGFGNLNKTFGSSRFNSLICLGNSLPHLLDEAALVKTLHDFAKILTPGGKIIIQNQNFDRILKERNRWMPPETYIDGEKTWLFARFYDFNPNGLITFNIMVFVSQTDGKFSQQIITTHLWPLKKTNLESYLSTSGFTDIQFFGDLQGSDYHKNSSGNLVITAKTK